LQSQRSIGDNVQLSYDSVPDESHIEVGSQAKIDILEEETFKVTAVAATVVVEAAGLVVMVVGATVVEADLVVVTVL
jgi:hypothetical protein